MKLPLSVLLALLALLSLRPGCLSAQGPAVEAAVPAGPGTVWAVDFVKTREGRFDDYVAFNRRFWKPARDEAVRRGHVLSYRMLTLPGNPEWDVLLMTEYPDQAAYEGREDAFRPILEALRRGVDRPDPRQMADIRFTRTFRAPPANNPGPAEAPQAGGASAHRSSPSAACSFAR